MAEERKDLSLIHAAVDSIDRSESVLIDLTKVLDLQEAPFLLKLQLGDVRCLKVFAFDVLGFEVQT